jgi:hypothetical protein
MTISTANANPPAVEAALPPKQATDPTRSQAINVIRTALRTLPKKPLLMLVILSNGDKHIYSGIKHLGDSYLDVATVCVHSAKIRKEKGRPNFLSCIPSVLKSLFSQGSFSTSRTLLSRST